jgi:hypothetical protein
MYSILNRLQELSILLLSDPIRTSIVDYLFMSMQPMPIRVVGFDRDGVAILASGLALIQDW